MSKTKLSPKSLLKDLAKKKKNKNNKILTNLKFQEVLELGSEKVINEFVGDNFENLDIKNLNSENYQEYSYLKLLLDSTSSCQISDAMDKLINNNGVLHGLKSINGKRAYGRIVTAKTKSDDWGTSLLAIDTAHEGEIIFIHSTGKPSAIWGELTSLSSYEKKLSGTVICGAVRDIDFLDNFDFPVFAYETVPNAGEAYGFGKVNISLTIGDTKINPGDFLFGDLSGVVVVPQEIFKHVMRKLIDIKINESEISYSIKNGKSISDILGLQ
jgi:regulator of RNase E activity RraA